MRVRKETHGHLVHRVIDNLLISLPWVAVDCRKSLLEAIRNAKVASSIPASGTKNEISIEAQLNVGLFTFQGYALVLSAASSAYAAMRG